MNQPQQFDVALNRLTIITETLEKGESSLEDLVKLFEEGMELSVYCHGILERTEGQITRLIENMQGELDLIPYADQED